MNASSQTERSAANRPGLVLRNLRKRRGWTLTEASQRSGLPVSTLSKIENDRMSLNYDKLTRLCQALEMDISEFFATDTTASPAAVTGRRSITRAGEGKSIDTASYFHIYPAADLLNKSFVPIIAELHAHSLEEFGELVSHPGEEYTYVIEGTVEIHTEMYAPTLLEKGDSIYFDSGMGHAYLAVGTGPCRVLSICSTSESQLIAQFSARKKAGVPPPKPKAAKSSKTAPALDNHKRKNSSS